MINIGTLLDISFCINIEDFPLATRLELKNNPESIIVMELPDEAGFSNVEEWQLYYEPDDEEEDDVIVVMIPEMTAEDLGILSQVILNKDFDIKIYDPDDFEEDEDVY